MRLKVFRPLVLWWLCALTLGVALALALHGCAHGAPPPPLSIRPQDSDVVRRVARSSVTVLVRTETDSQVFSGIGSGTVIWSNGLHALVLTCHHVVWDEDSNSFHTLIRVQARGGEPELAVLEESSKDKDLALLYVTNAVGPSLPLAAKNPEMYDRVFVLGSPDGVAGTAYPGMISGKSVSYRGVELWTVNSFVFPGVSGGTVANDRGELVCVPESVRVTRSPFGQPSVIPQIGFCVPLPSIRDFLKPYVH